MGHSENLSGKQLAALDALTKARTLSAVAKEAGVDRRTLWTWMNEDAEFKAAYRAVKAQAFEGLCLGLLNLSESAIAGYAEVFEGPGIGGAMTLSRTSEAVVNQIFRLKELFDVDERLSAVEARLEGLGYGDQGK